MKLILLMPLMYISMEAENLLSTAVEAALEAGKAILEIYDTDFEVETKSDDSPLTIADQKANRIITGHLEKLGVPILSEEGKNIPFEERKNWEYLWIVDPLDGTKEFIKRNDEFTVNIALIKNNFPVMGVIYIPVLHELYYSMEDLGAYKTVNFYEFPKSANRIDELLHRSERLPLTELPEKFTIVASRSHLNDETKAFINDREKEHGFIESMTRGSSLKLCMVAEGRAHVYPRFAPTSEWDIAAGQAIVEESGGEVVEAETGERIQYNKQDILNPWFIVRRK